MSWTTDKPTQPGWYFAVNRESRDSVIINYVGYGCGTKLMVDPGMDWEDTLDAYIYWQKIEFPEIPK